MTASELTEFLLAKANQFENLSFIKDDPISIPHQFKQKEDIEIIGLLVATIAWGNRKSIIKSGNKYLFAVPYTPRSNLPIEAYFNQIKNTLKKNRNVENYQQLENNVNKAIEKVKPENYKNYFEYAYGTTKKTEYTRKPSTRKHKLKTYKI